MPDEIDKLFDGAVAVAPQPTQPDAIDALFDVQPMAPSGSPLAIHATMGPPSPQWQAEQDAMAQDEARQEIGVPNLWNNLKAGGKLAAIETLRGLHAVGGYETGDAYADQLKHQAEAAMINDPSKLGRFERGTAELFGNLALAALGPAGLGVFGLSGGGNNRLAAEDAGASDLVANLAGGAGMGLNVAMPAIAGKVAAPLAKAVGERVANVAPDAVEALFQRASEGAVGGAATGLGLTAGQAGIETMYDPRKAIDTLWTIPEQMGIMALLSAGHAAVAGHPEIPVPTLNKEQQALDALNAFDPQPEGEDLPPASGSVASGFNAQRLAELNAEQQRTQAGTAPDQAVKQGAPSDVSAPPKENVAPTVPAEPAPIQEQSNGQEVKAQGEAKAPPETDAGLLSPEHQPGALVDVRAGKQYLRGEVLSTDAAGKVNVKLADGRTLKGVPAFRVVPVKESVTAGIKSENKLNQEIKPESQPAQAAADIAPVDKMPAKAVENEPGIISQNNPAENSPTDDGMGFSQSGPWTIAHHPERKSAFSGRVESAGYQAFADNSGNQSSVGRRGFKTRAEAEAWAKANSEDGSQATHVDEAAKAVDTNPTEAQKEAGNYEMGHVKVHGLDITIENPKGSERSGTDANGKPWSVEMPAHYGYVKRTTGADGEHVDVYIGDHPENDRVYVVDQIDAKTGKFDEHKVMMGFNDQAEAVKAYDAAFSDGKGPERRGAVTPMPVEAFRRWLGKKRVKPLAYGTRVPVRDSRIANDKPEVVEAAKDPTPENNQQNNLQNKLPSNLPAAGEAPITGKPVFSPDREPGDAARIEELAKRASTSDVHETIDYRGVDDEEAQHIKDATGLDVRGFQHSVDNYAIKHAMTGHSAEVGETSRNQIALTPADFARLPEVMAAPDSIERSKSRRGQDALIYRKRFNGTTIAVEEVRTGRKRLALVTMWKEKSKSGAPDAPTVRPSPASASETFPGTSKGDPSKPEGPDNQNQERLFAPERVPGEAEGSVATEEPPLAMPDPKEGIESLIAWALREREKTIEDLRKRVERGGSMVSEYRKELTEHEAVDPEALAKDMREYPQHYLRMMSTKGGSMTPVGVYRNRVQLPPQQPRVQVAPLPLTKGQAPDLLGTLRTLREDLRTVAPNAPTFDVDKAALPDKSGGAFDPRTGGITTRYHNDLDLVAHEVGHWAAKSYKLLPEPTNKEMRAELARFSVHGSPAKGEVAQQEGMAEYVRAWMVDPSAAETRAPLFAQHMREKVPPKVLEALRSYGDNVRRFEGATALQKMAAGQQRTSAAIDQQRKEGRWYAPIWQGIKEFLGKGIDGPRARPGEIPKRWKASLGTKARFHITDKESPALGNYLMSLAMVGKDPARMSPSEHWDTLRRGIRGVAAKIREGVSANGLPNIDGSVAIDQKTGEVMALPWLLGTTPKANTDFGAFMDKAHAYGSAQRTLELAERFTGKVENEIGRFAEAQIKEAGGDRLRMPIAEKRVKEFAEERRQALRAQLARLTAAGGGIDSATEVARKAVVEMEADPQRADVEEYLRRYRAWSDWNLQYVVDSELLSPSQAETIRQANQFYIDWHRVFADEDGPVNLGEAVHGSSRTMHNPLASLLHTTWGTITRGDRNRLDLAFVAPLRMHPTSSEGPVLSQFGRQISQEAADLAATKHHGFHDDGTGQKARVYHTQRLVQEMNPDGSPVMDRDGTPLERVQVEHWVFDPATEASREAMRAESNENPWNKITQGLVNLQRLAITSAPGFRYKVPVRDNIERILNSENSSGGVDIARGLRKTLTDPLTGEEIDIDKMYHQSGAGMAGWNRRTRDQAMADVFAHVEDLRKKGYRWMTPGGAWRAWQHFGETTENIARKAEFVAAYKKGRTKLGYSKLDASLYAMTHARGLLDTAESGKTIGQLNRYFLFLNAAVKGLERNTKMIRAAANAFSRKEFALGGRLAGTVALRTAVWGTSLAGLRLMTLSMLDDDKQEELLSQPAWKRDFAITIPDFGIGKLAIPKPYEWGWVGSGFERIADGMWASWKASAARERGDTVAAERWDEHAKRFGEGWGRSGVTALLPLKFDDVLGGGIAPIAEVAFNKSLFTGGPIIPAHEADKKLALRKNADEASLAGRGLSAALAPVVGDTFGDPRSVDHLLRGYLGGWGSTGTARSFGEVVRRFTGYSGETSPYAERDVSFVLDWAAKEGVAARKPFARLRDLIRAAKDAPEDQQPEMLVNMRRRAMSLRRQIENNPRSLTKRPVMPDDE